MDKMQHFLAGGRNKTNFPAKAQRREDAKELKNYLS
jgi:hypothetical protein